MHHGTELGVVILVSVVLCLGAIIRLGAGILRIPYTIAMLLAGLGTGVALGLPALGFEEVMAGFARDDFHPGIRDYLLYALGSGMHVRPDLIMFCFLPALVFESAYAIDLHTFKKTVGPAIVFAGPAMLVATALSGGMLFLLLPVAGWDWEASFVAFGQSHGEVVENGALLAALYFGALISATDPVAVVALLRELGVSKKMAHLIEGESLLNDGTAIVVSGVLLELVVGEHFHGVGSSLVHFGVVVAGGLLVGWVLALLASWILGRAFNDPMVEITTTIVLGYMAMWIAEGMLHVSGVMALVAAGLWMGGPARTKVSPEVSHFLHHFWELLAYLANTLIFFLVGMIIGTRLGNATAADFALIVAVYFGIMAIRWVLTAAFRPLANQVGDPISMADVLVVSWGGLRGAVSMALVLAVATNPMVPAEVSEKMLLLTAGVVFLTIAVNGMTMGPLLAKLGFNKPPISEAMATTTAQVGVLDKVRAGIEELRTSRELRTVSWNDVVGDIETRRGVLAQELGQLRGEFGGLGASEREGGVWGQVLGIEREAYWHAFGTGTLGSRAVKALDAELNSHLDRLLRGEFEPPATRTPAPVGPRAALSRALRDSEALSGVYASLEFDNLALQYDKMRAVASAASRVLSVLAPIQEQSPEVGGRIRSTYERYLAEAKQGLEEMRVGMPEITAAIETRLAQRIALNLEREEYEKVGHKGVIEESVAMRFAGEVEARMQRLAFQGTRAKLPDTEQLLAEIPLFEALDRHQRARVAEVARLVVVPAGEVLFRQGDRGDSMFVVVRGAVHVTLQDGDGERLLDVLGGGDIIGEMALLTGEPRSAGALCATAVTLIRIGRDAFEELMASSADLSTAVWHAFARRRFDNHLRGHRHWQHLDHDRRCAWFDEGEFLRLGDGDVQELDPEAAFAFVVTGAVRPAGSSDDVVGPALVDLSRTHALAARGATRLVALPRGAA